ncbi:hypothetical protein DKX38_022571 [Salix brachista]|uniref:DUF4283 domain-containing protein n=1 Tax=Salix brachista TaxID=2182728 RepID=A0A5N5K0I7_9ROSI|nr:hypothetical protein DKX38_022571 [Salix brachista]
MTNDVVFIAGASDLCPNGGKRPRTNEVRDFGGTASSPPSPPPLPMSFKDKVFADFGKAEDNMVIGDEDYIIQNGEVPSIQFSDKIKECLWQLKRSMTLIDLENNFFIVKFLLEEDMEYVLTGGLWQVVGQYVTTQRFDVLEKIGKLIGLTVKVDPHTMSQSRGKFARICVELDISKPLTLFIEVEGLTYWVVYEGIQTSEATEVESMKDVTGLDKRVVEIENLEATRTEQVLGVAVSAGNVHVEQNKHLSTRSHFTILEADGNRGYASKDTTNTNQNSLNGVKKATHNLIPKRSFGRRKLPLTDCATSSSWMTYVNLRNKTMPLNCVGVVGLQVQGSDFQHDVQGVFSFNVGVPLTLTPEHDHLNIDSMDVTNDGHVPNVQASISAEHSQALKAPARSDSDLSNELPNANDVTAAVQRDKILC